MTITQTFTVTPTSTNTPVYTATSAVINLYSVTITIFDEKGRIVRQLSAMPAAQVVHNVSLSNDPYMLDGNSNLVFTDSISQAIGSWDGRDKDGALAATGPYMAEVKTKDRDGNEYTVIKTFSVILGNSGRVENLKISYGGNMIRITGVIINADQVSLKIYNIYGELVKSFQPESLNVSWDMRVVSGAAASSGVYVLVIEAKDKSTGMKISRFEKLAIRR
jgi:flagellar hook assembly protein FlgD